MPSAVDWGLAERVAVRVAGHEPLAASYHYDRLASDFSEVTAQAEALVADATGLRSASGPARARVVDRADWVRANLASFGRLLRPLTDRMDERVGDKRGVAAVPAVMSRRAAGVEVGALLGWMATRVLGQYDLLVIEDEDPDDQDIVYYVGPNVLALEKRYGFPPQEFRLWLALHEVTHRAQFTGVPWLRGHFLSLVEQTLDAVDPDPKRFLDALGRVVDELRSGHNPLDEGGVATLLASPDQRDLFGRIGGMMSLLEGHGDVTMDRAGAGHVPSADRFSRALRERRKQGGSAAKMLQKA
ncbi:MAG: zinc-dependent metalloprotease, partial [Acidimicrobiales bacterium]